MLGDDAELNLAGPALDRIGLGAQPLPRRLAGFGTLALPFERAGAARGHDQLVPRLVELGPGIFLHRRLGRMRLPRLQLVDEQLRTRSEERRVGKEGVSTCRFRWSTAQ